MKAEEIRSRTLCNARYVPLDRAFELEILQEIAAQLAELNVVKQQPVGAQAKLKKAVIDVIYDCCHSLSQPSMQNYTWGTAKDYLTEHVGREVDRVLATPQGEWVKAPPTEPGCYWATRHQGVFIAEREAYDGLWHTRGREEGATDEEVKNLGWEFWSMKLEEPK